MRPVRPVQVLQKQHNALLLRLELWLSKLDEQLPQLPPKTVTEWTRQVTPAVSNRISGSSARGRRRSETAEEDKGEEKPLRRSIHSEDYELAQSEADRIESMKNLAMASRQTSKTRQGSFQDGPRTSPTLEPSECFQSALRVPFRNGQDQASVLGQKDTTASCKDGKLTGLQHLLQHGGERGKGAWSSCEQQP